LAKRKKVTLNQLDKMSFEKRERLRKKLKQNAATTKTFWTTQKFGAAGKCVSISIEDYLSNNPNPEVIKVIKNESE
jgi:hypothetical protein